MFPGGWGGVGRDWGWEEKAAEEGEVDNVQVSSMCKV